MIDRRPGRRVRALRTTPRRGGVSLIRNRFRRAARSGRASHVLAVLHQVIVLLEVVKNLADLIGLRVQPAHHLALLCQLMLTLLQGKHVEKRRIVFPRRNLPQEGKDHGERAGKFHDALFSVRLQKKKAI